MRLGGKLLVTEADCIRYLLRKNKRLVDIMQDELNKLREIFKDSPTFSPRLDSELRYFSQIEGSLAKEVQEAKT